MARLDHAREGSTIAAVAEAIRNFRNFRLTPEQVFQAELLLIDTIGCGLLGSRNETARAVVAATIAKNSPGPCMLLGRRERTGVLDAVLINATAVRVLDFNDYFVGQANGEPESGGHPSDNIPVALAVGAQRHASGLDVLKAIVLGYELYYRLQRLMDRAGNWDGVCVSGLVAPAMAGYLMGLGDDALAHGIALGAARAATPSIVRRGGIAGAKSIANGLVAQSGVQAALLAEAGITAPLNILDDARGLDWLFAKGDKSLLSAPLAGAAVMAARVKLYPCVNMAQSAVAAAVELHREIGRDTGSIQRVEILMADYPIVRRQQEDDQRRNPQSREAADHSPAFLVAVTLIDGVLGVGQYTNARWTDPAVVALMCKIEIRRDPAWNRRAPGEFPCTIRVHLHDGRTLAAEIASAAGPQPNRPRADVVTTKFHSMLSGILHRSARDRVVDAIMELHHSPATAALDGAITTGEFI